MTYVRKQRKRLKTCKIDTRFVYFEYILDCVGW